MFINDVLLFNHNIKTNVINDVLLFNHNIKTNVY
jgi:hypothetical protein